MATAVIGPAPVLAAAFDMLIPSFDSLLRILLRQLPPEPSGLPIEIYTFTSDTRWGNYEAIQADIFDHILAVVSEFELRVLQEPAGKDFDKIASSG
ncbi:MAG: hypothetical protein ACETWG_02030 [Candidatus Neomarinimicrobiota bacterium]